MYINESGQSLINAELALPGGASASLHRIALYNAEAAFIPHIRFSGSTFSHVTSVVLVDHLF